MATFAYPRSMIFTKKLHAYKKTPPQMLDRTCISPEIKKKSNCCYQNVTHVFTLQVSFGIIADSRCFIAF